MNTSKTVALLCAAAMAVAAAARGDDWKPGIEVAAPQVIVQGFPAILRIRAHGPIMVPHMSLLGDDADIRITIREAEGPRTYELRSERSAGVDVVGGPAMKHSMPGHLVTNTYLEEAQSRTSFLDLWSLKSSKDSFSRMPPGKYRLRVEFLFADSKANANANEVLVELQPPTEAERAFLQEVKKAFRIREARPMAWNRLLWKNSGQARLSPEQLQKLSAQARSQLSLHLLFKELEGANPSITEIEAWSVPEYLVPGKAWLLLQTRVRRDLANADRILDEFTKAHPEWKEFADRMRLRLQRIAKGAAPPLSAP